MKDFRFHYLASCGRSQQRSFLFLCQPLKTSRQETNSCFHFKQDYCYSLPFCGLLSSGINFPVFSVSQIVIEYYEKNSSNRTSTPDLCLPDCIPHT